MPESRRQLLAIFMGAVSAMAAEPLFGALAPQARSTPQARPYPNGRDPNVPPDAEHRVLDPKAIELQNQNELRSDVAKLYEMVSDLKQQLEKTDPATTLSISLVKKTEQIEKLAKQIKSLARG